MSLLRFGGKDPQGNAKGISTDNEGAIRSTISSAQDFTGSVPAEGSVETDVFRAQSNFILITAELGVSAQREIDVHWLNSEGYEFTVDENIITGTGFKKEQIEIKSVYYKFTIRNTHTSSRTVRLSVGSFVGSEDRSLLKLVEDYRKELVRPKHTIIGSGQVTIPANDRVTGEDLLGSSGKYRYTTRHHYCGDFSFVYAMVYVDGGTTNNYYLDVGFSIRFVGLGELERSDYNGYKTEDFATVEGPRFADARVLETNSERAITDWIEVKGNTLRNVGLENNDDVERTFNFVMMGVR